MRAFNGFFIFLALSFSGVYFFASGLPQISDYLYVFFVFSTLFLYIKKREGLSFDFYFKLFLVLVLWVLLVSIVWSIIRQNIEFMISPAYYFFNFAVAVCLFYYLRRQGITSIYNSIIISLLVSLIAVVFLGKGGRETGFFNNPNQLAYHTLCAACVFVVLIDFKFKMSVKHGVTFLSVIICLLSASSLAGFLGFLVLVAACLYANRSRLIKLIKIVIGLFFVLFLFFVYDVSNNNSIITTVENRLIRSESKIDNAYSERKYDRLLYFPEYIFLGAGEAEYNRFKPLEGGEIHSTYANLLFSYGIVGLAIFLGLIVCFFNKLPIHVFILICSPLVYSITHMGLRSTMFWVLLTIVYYLYIYNPKRRLTNIG